jgi:hypothetical protein
MGKVVELRRVDAEDRFRDRLATARAISRPLIDEDAVTEAVLEATADLAEESVVGLSPSCLGKT